jgi:hypothetical protein
MKNQCDGIYLAGAPSSRELDLATRSPLLGKETGIEIGMAGDIKA